MVVNDQVDETSTLEGHDEEWRLHQVHLEKRLSLLEKRVEQIAAAMTEWLIDMNRILGQ